MSVSLPLRARDGSVRAWALVSDEDAHLAQFRWCLASRSYVVRRDGDTLVKLHRVVMDVPTGDLRDVDHKNGNPLDCQRHNLRVVTHAQNMQNVAPRHGTSAHRGVGFDARHGKWSARARVDGVRHWLGSFDTESAAADAAREFRAAHMPYANEERKAACQQLQLST